jgi:hypothetical protein
MTSARAFTFTATHGMIMGVHGNASHFGSVTKPTVTSGFAKLTAFVFIISDLTDACSAQPMKTPNFTGWQFDQDVFALLGHQLCGRSGTTHQLSTLADAHFNVVYGTAEGDIAHWQTVARLDINVVACFNDISYLDTKRGQYIPLFTIEIIEECNIGRAVWIIFNGSNPCRYAYLVSFEINKTVFSFMPAANMT